MRRAHATFIRTHMAVRRGNMVTIYTPLINDHGERGGGEGYLLRGNSHETRTTILASTE